MKRSSRSSSGIAAAARRFRAPACAGVFVLALAGMLAGAGSPASAQPPEAATEAAVADSASRSATLLPPAVQAVGSAIDFEAPDRELNRSERRAYRAKTYAARIDSLIQSRNYLFFPNSMQSVPGGLIRMIYADYFYFGLLVDHVEVHLPIERGLTQYVEMLNFDSMSIRDYRAARIRCGWSVSFDAADGDVLYHADFTVSTVTGETVLTLLTPAATVRYVGWLWDKRRK